MKRRAWRTCPGCRKCHDEWLWEDDYCYDCHAIIGGGRFGPKKACAAPGCVAFRTLQHRPFCSEQCQQVSPKWTWYKVTDLKGSGVGIRKEPDTSEGSRCGRSIRLNNGERFEVSEVVNGGDAQQYLKLADGRGWVFTRHAKDGRLLCEPDRARLLTLHLGARQQDGTMIVSCTGMSGDEVAKVSAILARPASELRKAVAKMLPNQLLELVLSDGRILCDDMVLDEIVRQDQGRGDGTVVP